MVGPAAGEAPEGAAQVVWTLKDGVVRRFWADEMNEADQAELARATAQANASNASVDGEDQRLFKTNLAQTTFG